MAIAPKRSFEVVVEGQYIAHGDHSSTPTVKFYKETFILPSQEAALSKICKHVLAPRLRKVHKDFIRYRTHKLVSITAVGVKPNTEVLQMSLDDMSVAQLSDFCILKGIMIDPYIHSNTTLCRERVAEQWRLIRQAKKDAATTNAGQDQKEADALLALNDLPKDDETVVVNMRERAQTAAVQNKSTASIVAAPVTRPADEPIESDDPLPPISEDPAPVVDDGELS